MIKIKFSIKFLLLLLLNGSGYCDDWRGPSPCKKSVTTASGIAVHGDGFCSDQIIFEDNFDTFDFEKWQHENTLSGGGNWEFQWYTNNRSNSFVENGKLYIRPTLTSNDFGEGFLSSGTINVHGGAPADQCTNAKYYGCERTGNSKHIVNPIKSARLRTVESFNFKFGRVVVKAQLPSGDWLWPAIWLLPKRNAYGTWPASGEIDIVESRGNNDLKKNGVNIGSEQIGSTLHFGPYSSLNGYKTAHFERNSEPNVGFDKDFHIYEIIWTPKYIKFLVDKIEMGTVNASEGFWHRAGFPNNIDNPWKNGSPMAPFDQEFFLVFNVAVGGVSYFPDNAENPTEKPWINNSPNAATNFWDGRSSWLPTWNLEDTINYPSALKIDYVRVYAL